MFPGMNKKALEQAMKKLNMKQEEIPATEVIIKTVEGKDIIVKNPQVVKVNMMGQETLQITGDMQEAASFSDEDVKTVAEQANVSLDDAKAALEKADGDIAQAILDLAK